MYRNRNITFARAVALSLVMLASLWITVIPRHAEAGQNRGEGYITGRSLSDFSGTGHIDIMEKEKLVIDDCSKELSSRVQYYKPGPKKISKSAFSVGSRVGYVEDRNGEIISLWLLPRAKTRK